MNKKHSLCVSIFLLLILISPILDAQSMKANSDEDSLASQVILLDGHDLQKTMNEAPAYSRIICDRKQELIISSPVLIRKPLTLEGLNARLPDSLHSIPILIVESKHVTITNFMLVGNANTVSQENRAPLIAVLAGEFHLSNGHFENSSKDGVMISPAIDGEDIVGVVVRDIVGRGVVRDVVSLSGTAGGRNPKVRNVLVENIRAYDSELRGPVEVSDGTDNITVRKIYAENCRYAIDVQDHKREVEINRNVYIEDVYALNCEWAVRTYNHRFGHANLTLANITSEHCQKPVQVSNTDNVMLQNIRILDHVGDGPALDVSSCNMLTIRDVSIFQSHSEAPGILVKNCQDVVIDGVSLLEKTESLSSAVTYRITKAGVYSNLRIYNVTARDVSDAGIILESKHRESSLENYIISNNLAKISDRIKGSNVLIINNIE